MFRIDREYRDRILAQAREEHPSEACGILAGKRDNFGRKVLSKIYPCKNVHRTPESDYLISPEETLETFESIEEEGKEILGSYHSHIEGSAVPSEKDTELAQLGQVYLIASLEKKEIRAWRWTGDRFEEEKIEFCN